MGDKVFVELADGTKITIKKPTVRAMLDFVKVLDKAKILDKVDADTDGRGTGADDHVAGEMLNTMQFIFGDVVSIVSSATNIPEDELENMDPGDYVIICKKVIEVYSGFLESMGSHVK